MKKHLLWIGVMGLLVATQQVSAATISYQYQYDELGRLITVTQGASVVRYTYDAADNRKSMQVTSVTPTVISMASPTAQVHQGSVVLTVNVGDDSTTGTVSFYDGATFVGSASVVGGVASVEIVGLSVGAHNITVSYAGNGTDPSNSISFPVNVTSIDWLPAVLQILLN
ncbi:MAG: Ig-like domain repeat protein [Steroidobacter sp.]